MKGTFLGFPGRRFDTALVGDAAKPPDAAAAAVADAPSPAVGASSSPPAADPAVDGIDCFIAAGALGFVGGRRRCTVMRMRCGASVSSRKLGF